MVEKKFGTPCMTTTAPYARPSAAPAGRPAPTAPLGDVLAELLRLEQLRQRAGVAQPGGHAAEGGDDQAAEHVEAGGHEEELDDAEACAADGAEVRLSAARRISPGGRSKKKPKNPFEGRAVSVRLLKPRIRTGVGG